MFSKFAFLMNCANQCWNRQDFFLLCVKSTLFPRNTHAFRGSFSACSDNFPTCSSAEVSIFPLVFLVFRNSLYDRWQLCLRAQEKLKNRRKPLPTFGHDLTILILVAQYLQLLFDITF